MKKMFLLTTLMCIMAFSANAQLGAPTTKVKDTFDIVSVTYNGTRLNRADWPATIIVMDANNFYIAKHVYKIKPQSHLTEKEKAETIRRRAWSIPEDPTEKDPISYAIYYTICNKKKVTIKSTHFSSSGRIRFEIGEDYSFVVERRTHHL